MAVCLVTRMPVRRKRCLVAEVLFTCLHKDSTRPGLYWEPLNRAAIVYNPASRNAPRLDRLQLAARSLRANGWQIDVLSTAGPGDATACARQAASDGARVVFACGGDGTLNEVANGLAGSACAAGVIRGGMGNVFAKEVGVPRDPEAALRVLLDGSVRRFDLGIAGNRFFLVMAGAGFDAEVVRRVPSRPKRLLGSTSYALWGAATLARFRSRPVDLVLDGKSLEVDLFWLLLGNTRSYGGVLDVAREALADDGLLDCYVFGRTSRFWLPAAAARLALRHPERAAITFERINQLDITTPGLAVQADGEYIGQTPMRFAVQPAALSVLLPRGRGNQLFRDQTNLKLALE